MNNISEEYLMKICVNCQKQYQDNMSFCPNCGSNLITRIQYPVQQQINNSIKVKNNGLIILADIFSFVTNILAIISLFYLLYSITFRFTSIGTSSINPLNTTKWIFNFWGNYEEKLMSFSLAIAALTFAIVSAIFIFCKRTTTKRVLNIIIKIIFMLSILILSSVII